MYSVVFVYFATENGMLLYESISWWVQRNCQFAVIVWGFIFVILPLIWLTKKCFKNYSSLFSLCENVPTAGAFPFCMEETQITYFPRACALFAHLQGRQSNHVILLMNRIFIDKSNKVRERLIKKKMKISKNE